MSENTNPAFAKFVATAAKHGVGKNAAYELANAGLLKPFKIGNATYIELREFEELPKRLADPAAQARLASVKARKRAA